MKRNMENSREQMQKQMDRNGKRHQQDVGSQRSPQGSSNTQASSSRSGSADMDELEGTKGTVGSRQTGNNAEDRAGVADIDKRMKR